MNKHENKIAPFDVQQALVALELEEPDQVILDYLGFLARRVTMGHICFMHVLPAEDIFNITDNMSEDPGEKVDEALAEMMEIRVREALQTDERQVDYDIRKGDPLEVLLETAESLEADLTVIGQAKGDENHGILAKNLVRKIDSNALVIPEGSQTTLKRILVPIDFSENAARALQTAIAINKCLDVPAEIIALNAYDLPNMSSYKISRTREEFVEMFEENILEGFEAYCHTHIPNDRENVRVRLIEKEFPDTAGYILKYGEEHQIDLIVTGAKGHSRVELLLLGSVTEKLMEKNSGIPTLIVK